MDSTAGADSDCAAPRDDGDEAFDHADRGDDAKWCDGGAAKREATLRRWAMRRRLGRRRG